MHFFYGVGAFLTPIVVKSFLNSNFDIETTSSSFNCYNIDEVQDYAKLEHQRPEQQMSFSWPKATSSNLSSLSNTLTTSHTTAISSMLMSRPHFTSKMKYAFWILAVVQLPAPIILILVKLKSIAFSSYSDIQADEERASVKGAESSFSLSLDYVKSIVNDVPLVRMISLIAAMLFLFEGLQVIEISQLGLFIR
jgi:hypothetical protein